MRRLLRFCLAAPLLLRAVAGFAQYSPQVDLVYGVNTAPSGSCAALVGLPALMAVYALDSTQGIYQCLGGVWSKMAPAPVATASSLGLVRPDNVTVTVASNGVLSATEAVVKSYRAISSPTTITATDYQLEVTSGTFTQPLPTAVGAQGRMYSIKNSGTGVVTVSAFGAQTIDGSATQTLAQWDNLMVMSNGTNWMVI